VPEGGRRRGERRMEKGEWRMEKGEERRRDEGEEEKVPEGMNEDNQSSLTVHNNTYLGKGVVVRSRMDHNLLALLSVLRAFVTQVFDVTSGPLALQPAHPAKKKQIQ
jgi:hypothetical protein